MTPQRLHARARAAWVLLLTIAVSIPSRESTAQVATTDSLRAVIAATRAANTAAARIFLDSARTETEREQAAATVGAFLDSSDVRAALRIVGNPQAPVRIRLIALTKGAHMIDGDQAAESSLLRWIGDRATPLVIRQAGMNRLTAMLVGSGMRARRMPEIVRLLRELSSDPDSTLRRSALSWLVKRDSATVQRLIRSLRSGQDPLVTPVEAVGLLATSGSAEAKAAMRPLLSRPTDAAARTEAIRALGGDSASAASLDRIIADSREPDTVRAAALGAVFANRPQHFPTAALPLLVDEGASDDLRVFVIQAVRVRLRTPAAQLRISAPTRFTEEVRRLARDSASPRVRAAAEAYLSDQRP